MRRFSSATVFIGVGLALVLASPGCESGRRSARTQVPSEAAHTVLSLQEIDCQSCGMSVVTALERTSGVYEATFDRETAEIAVVYDAAAARYPSSSPSLTTSGTEPRKDPATARTRPRSSFRPG